jgi:CYTH domain-containing protein/thymidylate kinase
MHRIVLTGGPCSGKTTSISLLQEKISEMGFDVVCVPEVATLLIGSGIQPWLLNPAQLFIFQDRLIQTQLQLEKTLADLLRLKARDPRKTVLLLDRGCMDIKAYISPEQFDRLLARNRLEETDLRDKRYDAVFHLVTAADGAEKFYTTSNNTARSEKPEQAREIDLRTRNAWLGQPHLRVIDNSTDFQTKLNRLLKAVQRSLGVPVSLEIERKFLLRPWFCHKDIPVPYQEILIQQFYLKKRADGVTRRIRRRWQKNSGEVYYLTHKQATANAGTNIETEKHISRKQYEQLMKEVDARKEGIAKQRFCFLWKNQYFELDVFLEPKRIEGLSVLEIELTEENDRVELPDFLKVQKEVTGDERYSNSRLAKKAC